MDGPSSARRLAGETRREPRSGSRLAQMVLVTFAVTKVSRQRRKLLTFSSLESKASGRDAQGTAQWQPFGADGFGDFCHNKNHPPQAEAFDLDSSLEIKLAGETRREPLSMNP